MNLVDLQASVQNVRNVHWKLLLSALRPDEGESWDTLVFFISEYSSLWQYLQTFYEEWFQLLLFSSVLSAINYAAVKELLYHNDVYSSKSVC